MVIKITPQQAKRVNALLRKLCANYDGGNCLLLHFGHEKACLLFAEPEAADLIEHRRQGQGKAGRIYLKKFLARALFIGTPPVPSRDTSAKSLIALSRPTVLAFSRY